MIRHARGRVQARPAARLARMRAALARFRSFPAPARAFLAGAALLEVGHAFQWALQNLYVMALGGFSVADAGLVNAASALGVVAATLPAAWAYDRLGPRRSLSLACALNVAGVAWLALSTTLPGLMAGAALAGAAYTLHTVVAAPFLVSVSTPAQRTALFQADFAVHTLVQTFGLLVSCLLAGLLEAGAAPAALALRLALLAGAAGSLAALPLYRRLPQGVGGAPRAAGLFEILHPRHWPLWTRAAVPNLLIGVGAGLSVPFINLYFTDRFGLGKPALGVVMAAASATMTLGALATTRVVPRLGLVRATILTQALSIPFFLVLALATSLPLAIAACVLRSALMNLATPLWRNLVMEITPVERRAGVNATTMLAWNVGWAASNHGGGALIDGSAGWLGTGLDGYALPMLLTIGIYLLAIAVEARVFWRHRALGLAPSGGPAQPPAAAAAGAPADGPALRG